MSLAVVRGDARSLPLPDGSVDLIVTSPPYFGLRSYTDTCRICLDIKSNGLDPASVIVDYEKHTRTHHHYEGQIGSEATPQEWLAALVACTAEWMRVLKPSGSIFVNLGDKFSDRGHGPSRGNGTGRGPQNTLLPQTRGPMEKSLLGLPWRYAIACTDQLGLILRRDIIWSKPNGLPESVTDRCRSSHEYVFHLVKQPRYYAAVDEIREAPNGNAHARRSDGQPSPMERASVAAGNRNGYITGSQNPLGKLPGSVWDIPSQPLTVPARLGIDHFAAFPMELPRRIILGWSPPGVCVACGEGRRPVTEQVSDAYKAARAAVQAAGKDAKQTGRGHQQGWMAATAGPASLISNGVVKPSYAVTGYACACPEPTAPTRPGVVVDPFGGTGTAALVAAMHGRHGITVDMSADYCRLAAWRTRDPAERAKAMQVPKPPPVPDGMEPLFATP